MTTCPHDSLKPIGEQRTDEGMNSYFKCKKCGSLVVVTPARNLIAVPAV
jgi:hypothetical protein